MMKRIVIFLLLISLFASQGYGQDNPQKKLFEIYGLVMTDIGYNFNQINPDWYDVVRPIKLPAYKNEYGTDGNVYFSVRQSTFGMKGYVPTKLGEIYTIFEFDVFGTGKNAGQIAFHLRKAYAELGRLGVGQHWSNFVDFSIFPNCLEYWGPNGMALCPNIFIRFIPIKGRTHLYISLEKPGATADQGVYQDHIELQNVKMHLPFPDLTAEYHRVFKFGYIELAGLLKYIGWKNLSDTAKYDLKDYAIGWGFNLTSNVNFTKKTVGKFGVVFGDGIENYMNDAPTDIGIQNNFSDTLHPIKGVALPCLGISAFIDHNWSQKFSSSIGYSLVKITNSDGQKPDAFKLGHYALANLLYYPVAGVMAGVELQFSTRENYLDGWKTQMWKLQFSFRYNFGHIFYQKEKPD
jgi:hypothetical protein